MPQRLKLPFFTFIYKGSIEDQKHVNKPLTPKQEIRISPIREHCISTSKLQSNTHNQTKRSRCWKYLSPYQNHQNQQTYMFITGVSVIQQEKYNTIIVPYPIFEVKCFLEEKLNWIYRRLIEKSWLQWKMSHQ